MRTRAGRRAAPVARQPDSLDAAYAEAVKRLARQPRSRAALERRLHELGYAEEAVDGALARAQADGYLNDREYAEALVRRRSAGRGHTLIAQELRAKGIQDADSDAALGQLEPEAETEQAVTLGRRLLTGRSPADAEALYAYIGPRLSRRGFSSGLVYRVCRVLADEWQAAGRFDSL